MMRLYLIRHAQSENNALYAAGDSFVGRQVDPGLTAVGQAQAKRLAANLAARQAGAETSDSDHRDVRERRGLKLTHIYTSLMQRAILTARPLAETLGLPMRAWIDLHEWWGYYDLDHESGERTGLPGPGRAHFEERHPDLELPTEMGAEGWWSRPVETAAQWTARAERVVATLRRRHLANGDHVVLVTHAGFTQSLLGILLNQSSPNPRLGEPLEVWFMVNNAAVTRVDVEDEAVILAYSNRLEHLPEELVT
ncbi:MAG: histidine phosphatase family protein [Candidatus Promineifilaceae bacterium]|nr:histidine phosphatase family protein [Candidatus Promineifilaceae bacterium]